jgi:hypothetical protein
VAMPEAAVHEDSQHVARENEVGGTGQMPTMEPETVAERVKVLTQSQLRPGILGLDTSHHP